MQAHNLTSHVLRSWAFGVFAWQDTVSSLLSPAMLDPEDQYRLNAHPWCVAMILIARMSQIL